ncbi:MAG TPA: EAL domain-containing protein [Allosphingosinicella sp.]|jgi:diguanylate cyclase (GGDEF)-like protein/PAS domain S-box-containing protein
MARRAAAAERLPRPRLPVFAVLGLGEAEAAWIEEARAAQMRIAAAALPFLLVAQLLAGAVAAGAALAAGRLDAVLVPAGGAVAAGIAVWLFLLERSWRGLKLSARLSLAVVAAACMGLAQAFLLRACLALPPAPIAGAAACAAAAALIVGATALLPIRIASLAVAATGALVAAPMAGIAATVETLFLLLFAGLLWHLARHDLTTAFQRMKADRESGRARRLVREHENHGTGWFWETDRTGRITYLSEKVLKELGAPGEPAIGRPLTEIFEMDSGAPETERSLSFHLSSRTSFSDYSVRSVDGKKDLWWSISGRPMVDKFGQFRGFIGGGSDLSAKRRAEAEITRLALFDSLTGLANRQRMRFALDQALAQPQGSYRPTALFLLDLDRFKAVNDTLGHQTGDELLKQVAQRLIRTIGDAGMVGRLGGDEFEIVLPGENDRDALARLAKAVIASLSQPYAIGGTSISIGCSIGIAVAPDDGDESQILVRNADLALYAAKGDGRGVHRFYREEMLVGAKSRKMLEDDLRKALADGQLHLAYQPVVSTIGAEVVGFEALIRWTHPARGPVSPVDFIPVAEECGMIEAIGEWVLRTACAEAVKWPDSIRVAVNVSAIQFVNPAFPRLVVSALAASGLPPHRLELEITESVFLDEGASSDETFGRLKAIGIRLALDDFGTGYSSLGYLRKAPFDKIKIDQSFVRGAAAPGSRNAAIIRAIVTLAETLGMETTAEGVEVQDEIALIRELGCSHIQGYVYGRPMKAEDAERLVGDGGGKAQASGYRVSRAPRTTMFRSARLELHGRRRHVRIRNISSSGAMIDGLDGIASEAGAEVMIELIEEQMFRASLRWVKDGKAGLQFAEPFDLSRLKMGPEPRALRYG